MGHADAWLRGTQVPLLLYACNFEGLAFNRPPQAHEATRAHFQACGSPPTFCNEQRLNLLFSSPDFFVYFRSPCN